MRNDFFFLLLAISLSLSLSTESYSQEEKMPVSAQNKGSIAILRDDIPVSGAASSPEYLASVLENGGYKIRFIRADDLCDGKLMIKDNFSLLVLPYGASYPAMGKDALISYLNLCMRLRSV